MALRQLGGPKLVSMYSAFRGRCGVLSHKPCLPTERRRHGDSQSDQKRAWAASDTYQTHQVGNHKSVQTRRADIISELNTMLSNRSSQLQERHSIHSRIGTLEGLGCSLDDIQAHPDVLLLSEVQVIKRVQRLRNLSVDKITVRRLQAASVVSMKLLQKRLHTMEFGSDVHRKLAELLDCSIAGLVDMAEKDSSFTCLTSSDKDLLKVQFLLSAGFTSDVIKQNMFILKGSLKSISTMISGMQRIRDVAIGIPVDLETIKLFIDSEKVANRPRNKEENGEEKQRLLARLLGVDVADIKAMRYTNVSFRTVVNKLAYIFELGIEKRDIVNHFYLLRHSFRKLVDGVASARESGISEMTAIALVNVIQHRSIPARLGRPRHQYFLSSVLEMTHEEFLALGPHVGKVCSVDKMTLKANIKYLLGKGFSMDDIKQCLLVITHEPEVLRTYVEGLPGRREFQPYEEIRGDARVVLNAVQYLVERDANFSCSKEQMGVGMSRDQTLDEY